MSVSTSRFESKTSRKNGLVLTFKLFSVNFSVAAAADTVSLFKLQCVPEFSLFHIFAMLSDYKNLSNFSSTLLTHFRNYLIVGNFFSQYTFSFLMNTINCYSVERFNVHMRNKRNISSNCNNNEIPKNNLTVGLQL